MTTSEGKRQYGELDEGRAEGASPLIAVDQDITYLQIKIQQGATWRVGILQLFTQLGRIL
jgi:hypothetical protein